jgi:hypothetical protein
MKMEQSNQQDGQLHQALQAWKVQAALPPRFQEGVWQRIERAESETPRPAWLEMFRFLTSLVNRPALAVSYVTVLIIIGLVAGYVEASAANAHTGQMLSARYVQTLDPYQGAQH